MTLGIIPGMFVVLFFSKKMQGGILKLKTKDEKWGDIFMTSLFLGMISAFLGMVFADVRSGLPGFIPIFVMLFSALVMSVIGLLIKKCGMKWLETYALALSMLLSMVFAAIITPLIG
jgi:membrane glycosyltransferase